jgi:hypothetical protein
MDVTELLAKHGIKLKSYAPGQHSTTCPTCSARDNGYREKKCLSVKINDKGVCWRCNLCGWSGPEKGGGEGGGERQELQTYVYRDRDGVIRFRKVRNVPGREPRFWLERADGRGGWAKGTRMSTPRSSTVSTR